MSMDKQSMGFVSRTRKRYSIRLTLVGAQTYPLVDHSSLIGAVDAMELSLIVGSARDSYGLSC